MGQPVQIAAAFRAASRLITQRARLPDLTTGFQGCPGRTLAAGKTVTVLCYDRFPFFTRGEISAIGMVEHQRAHAGLRIHHESFRQLHADFFGP